MKLIEALLKGHHIKADAHAKYVQECQLANGKKIRRNIGRQIKIQH